MGVVQPPINTTVGSRLGDVDPSATVVILPMPVSPHLGIGGDRHSGQWGTAGAAADGVGAI